MEFTLKQLKAFHMTAELLNLTEAAESLHISPPAVSKNIRNLEFQFDNKLFSVSGKQLYLTDFGEKLFHLVGPYLASTEKLNNQMMQITHEDMPSVSILITNTTQVYVFKKIMDFKKRYPHINFDISTQNWNQMRGKVNYKKHDFVIFSEPTSLPDELHCTTIHKFKLMMVASHDHCIQDRKLTLDDLRELLFISSKTVSPSQTWFNESVRKWGLVNPPLLLENIPAVREAVLAGMGVSMLQDIIIQDDLKQGRLIELDYPIKSPAFRIVLGLNQSTNEAVKMFHNFMLSG